MSLRTETINGLTCRIVDRLPEGTDPQLVVVLCHGYGAPGTDLVPLGQIILQNQKLAGMAQFLFPEAPLSLEELGMPDGRAWWPLDMRRLQMAVALGSFDEMRKDCPKGLESAREKLLGLIQLWSNRVHVPLGRFVLGGFSQGSMLATDVALQLDENPAGLVIFSGTLLNEDVWRERASHHKTMRVLQSHGMDDPLLPFAAAGWLKDTLAHGGADVEFIPFSGSHEIPQIVLERLATFLRETAGDGRTSK